MGIAQIDLKHACRKFAIGARDVMPLAAVPVFVFEFYVCAATADNRALMIRAEHQCR